MRELLSNNSLFAGQLYADKSLALRARDLIWFTTDLQALIITQQHFQQCKVNGVISSVYNNIRYTRMLCWSKQMDFKWHPNLE